MRTRVRAAAVAAVVVGAAGGVLGHAARTLLRRQGDHARRLIGKPLGEQAPYADRVWKKSYGHPVDLLLLGDSIAAGLGAERRKDTLGGRLSKGLATHLQRGVRLRTVAVVGAESSTLAAQLDTLPPGYRADVAVVVVGGNDVTHRVPVAEAAAHLGEVVARLRASGTEVVVGTCPDLGMLRPVPQPLRSLGSLASRQLARAQTAAAVAAGAHAVSLSDVVGPFFVTDPDAMFSLDRFHPSALGYRRTAQALLPSLLTAVGAHERVPFGHRLPRLHSPLASAKHDAGSLSMRVPDIPGPGS